MPYLADQERSRPRSTHTIWTRSWTFLAEDCPDVHYGDDRHWVSGDLGVYEWLLTGTTLDGQRVRVRGCDHWEFRGDKIVRKDSYWKIVEPPVS